MYPQLFLQICDVKVVLCDYLQTHNSSPNLHRLVDHIKILSARCVWDLRGRVNSELLTALIKVDLKRTEDISGGNCWDFAACGLWEMWLGVWVVSSVLSQLLGDWLKKNMTHTKWDFISLFLFLIFMPILQVFFSRFFFLLLMTYRFEHDLELQYVQKQN